MTQKMKLAGQRESASFHAFFEGNFNNNFTICKLFHKELQKEKSLINGGEEGRLAYFFLEEDCMQEVIADFVF